MVDWKKEAIRWKKAFWASLDDSDEERAAILRKKRHKAKKTAKKPTKKHKKKTSKQLSLF